MNKITLPLPASELIPHRQTMLLIDTLVAYDRSRGAGTILAAAKAGTVFCKSDSGRAAQFLEEVVVLEMMAQAYACLRGYEDRLAGCLPALGFLVGIRHFELWRRVTINEDLTIQVATDIQVEDFFIADAVVTADSEKIAAAELKIWVPPAGVVN